MKINVIGCSNAWTSRPTSSYCINEGIIVDAGEGTLKYYERSNLNFLNIKTIFITHLHSDHTFALNAYLYQHMYYNDKSLKKSLTIYGPKGIKQHLFDIINIFSTNLNPNEIEKYVNIVEITDFNKTINIDNLKVKVFKLKHDNIDNVAYVFDDGKVKVGLSGDCTLTTEVEEFIKASDYLFLDCSNFKTTNSHLGLDDYTMLEKKYSDKKFYATHCVDEIYKNHKEYGITIAEDGGEYIF